MALLNLEAFHVVKAAMYRYRVVDSSLEEYLSIWAHPWWVRGGVKRHEVLAGHVDGTDQL
jgi:hypothetical protein